MVTSEKGIESSEGHLPKNKQILHVFIKCDIVAKLFALFIFKVYNSTMALFTVSQRDILDS